MMSGSLLLRLAVWSAALLWGCCSDEAPKRSTPILQWLLGDGPLLQFRRKWQTTWSHVQGRPDHYAVASQFGFDSKLADRMVDGFDRKGKLDDVRSTVFFHREEQVSQTQAKHWGESHKTLSKIMRAVEVHYKGSPRFNEFLQQWAEEMREFFPRILGMTAELWVSQPLDIVLPPHSDPESIFVLQLSGKETWRVCHKPETREDRSRTYTEMRDWRQIVEGDCDEFEMLPGDFLHIPAGCPHYARTHTKRATHLTFRPHMLTSCGDSASNLGFSRLFSAVAIPCDDYCNAYVNGTKCVSACDSGDWIGKSHCNCERANTENQENCQEAWASKICVCSSSQVASSPSKYAKEL